MFFKARGGCLLKNIQQIFKLFICGSQFKRILNYAKTYKYIEIVGIGLGTMQENGIYVSHIELCNNISKNPRYEFLIDSTCYYNIYKIIRNTEKDIVTIIHSHTINDVTPSIKDLTNMRLWNIPWLILNIDGEYKAWFLNPDNMLTSIETTIIDSC
uniref:JAB domain-containing protein n=1 Tax=Ignisphaera aggregans TaxID=334771 RepID=A0A7J3QD97_9CREN